jgi:hypothetical protein
LRRRPARLRTPRTTRSGTAPRSPRPGGSQGAAYRRARLARRESSRDDRLHCSAAWSIGSSVSTTATTLRRHRSAHRIFRITTD